MRMRTLVFLVLLPLLLASCKTAVAGESAASGENTSTAGIAATVVTETPEISVTREAESPEVKEETGDKAETDSSEEEETSRSLVVYFSRTGEQYGVGEISEGNTAVIAGFIAEKTGADLFEIVPQNDYPYDLQSLFRAAEAEQEENARPEYVGDVENWDAYDVVYIGYPLWFDDMPMILYHFLEDHDFSGKTVYPFDTCGSEGLLGTVDAIRGICTGADVREGLSVRGVTVQNHREEAEQAVEVWLEESNVQS